MGRAFRMKTYAAFAVSLALGLLAGWYVERLFSEREKTRLVQEMVEHTRGSEEERAARATLAIEAMQSGRSNEAVRLLAMPIAYYHALYADSLGKDERTRRLLARIDELAKTNQLVAARIAEGATNYRIPAP